MKNFEERYQNLNLDQKMAVDNIEGPVLVVAGPGSGKTELLSLRVAQILKETQMSPSNILLLTFTESGASNMRERIVGMIGEDGYRVAIYTFHAFAAEVMHKYPEYFFNGADFQVGTEIEKIDILENILKTLPKDNPLNSFHPTFGYTFLRDILSCIAALKKGNLTSSDFLDKLRIVIREDQEINQNLGDLLVELNNQKKFEVVRDIFLHVYDELSSLGENGNKTARFLGNILALELSNSDFNGKASNLTDFKNKYFEKNEEGVFLLKESKGEKIKKWEALAEVYEKYNLEMFERGLYDFDDMIFTVGRVLQKNFSLRADLGEKYQYIMIDEFQDTSDAQFNLVRNLTDFESNEGSPNILAVGDDDQAVFKFQGAELDNITKFIEYYPETKIITLRENYRSTQNILDLARKLITKIDDRLEIRYSKQISKNIRAANRELIEKYTGEIIEKKFENSYLEMDFIAKKIQEILDKGVDPEEITVISRTHRNLREIAYVFNNYEIPYKYEKEENVFEKAPILEIINIVKFAASGLENLQEEMLPEILTYPFWGLARIDVWKIAEKVRIGKNEIDEFGKVTRNRISWLVTMTESEDEKIRNIALFLIGLISEASSTPLLYLIDKIIGNSTVEFDLESDDTSEIKDPKENTFISPFREFYFGKENFEIHKSKYLDFLFALQTFTSALKEYKPGSILYAKDLIEFISIYENNKSLTLSSISLFASAEKAVTLQTAHKSKGLEYEYVFIINSDEKEWNSSKRSNIIGLPIVLPLFPSKDDISDQVRLYYVAMTRAKHTLYITYNKEKFSKLLTKEDSSNKKEAEKKELTKKLIESFYPLKKEEFLNDEKILLKNIIDDYKMPVTHLNNYLNISKIGPSRFIEQNLLRFPQAVSPSSAYGSAIHKSLENYFRYKQKYQKNPSLETIIIYFKNTLYSSSLSEIEFQKYYQEGVKNLEIYLKDLEKRNLVGEVEVEVDFSNEGVIIEGIILTGKIDRLEKNGNILNVVDLKTGKSFQDWEDGSTNYDKIKLHFFKYQLAFYYLLLKNSRSYKNFDLQQASLEFVEKDTKNKINILSLKNDSKFIELVNRVENLVKVVHKKIINLDFPNTDHYKINPKTGLEKTDFSVKDILEFEEDLLSGKI